MAKKNETTVTSFQLQQISDDKQMLWDMFEDEMGVKIKDSMSYNNVRLFWKSTTTPEAAAELLNVHKIFVKNMQLTVMNALVGPQEEEVPQLSEKAQKAMAKADAKYEGVESIDLALDGSVVAIDGKPVKKAKKAKVEKA